MHVIRPQRTAIILLHIDQRDMGECRSFGIFTHIMLIVITGLVSYLVYCQKHGETCNQTCRDSIIEAVKQDKDTTE